jgi:hypothetical protein
MIPLLLLVLAATPPGPTGPVLERYVVRQGDTCVSIARQRYGDAERVDLIHAYNALGPTPHHLAPGSVLRLPPPPPDAQLSFVRNHVQAFTPEEHAGRLDEPLQRGNKVSTLEASSAEVTFFDRSKLQLGEHTLIVIFGTGAGTGAGRAPPAPTSLLNGSLLAHLGELVGRKPAEFATPGAQVRGGEELRLHVDASKTARLAVYQGRSALESAGAKVEVPHGFGSKAELSKPPTPPRPLPGAPRWVESPGPLMLATGPAGAIAGSYQAGPGAVVASWHVQLARDAAFNDLLLDKYAPAEVTALSAEGLPPGAYHVRVSGIDGDAMEGPFSDDVPSTLVQVTFTPSSPGQPAKLTLPAGLSCEAEGGELVAGPAELPVPPSPYPRVGCALEAHGAPLRELEIPAAQTGFAPAP